MKNKINVARHVIFWSWNIIFISFVYLGLAPVIGPDISYGLQLETINKDYVAFFIVALVVPIISTLLGFIYLRKDSSKLLELMYCIELPLLALTLFRIFFLRDITAGVGFSLILFAVSSLYLASRLFFKKVSSSYSGLIGATVFLWCGTWIFLMLLFLIPPMAYGVFESVNTIVIGLSRLSLADLLSTMFGFFFVLIGSIFFIYSSTLFILFPVVYIYSSFKNWSTLALPLSRTNAKKVGAISFITAAVITTSFNQLTQQCFNSDLKKLQDFSGSDIEKTEISNKEEYYRQVLRDVYLAPYRYLGDESKTDFIQNLYLKTFGTHPESVKWIQTLFNHIARPFIYRGTSYGMAHDQQLAERLYHDLFDASIQEDERESIRYAVQSTYSREQIDAGLININERRVHLDRQDISIQEQGEWANIEIHEVYFNPSFRPEEIFLHLKLPPGAVINGVWLSDSDTKKFPASVAPRGAAQKVYKEIVKQGADPALVEQVGPLLYRLRVFPIPSNDIRYRDRQVMHMWLSLRLLKQNDTAWKMPFLTEKRNLYWDKNTKFTINGAHTEKGESWLPAELPVTQITSPLPLSASLGSAIIEMQPLNDANFSKNCSLAVIVDSSLSMRKRKIDILKAQENLNKFCSGNGVDYYIWKNGPKRIEGSFKEHLDKETFWGVLDSGDLANNFLPVENEKKTVVVITDRTFFRENEKVSNYSSINKPTWFLLMDQHYPRSINDHLLNRLYEVGGDIETKLTDIIAGITRHELKASLKSVIDVDQRYIWKIKKNGRSQGKNNSVEPLMAHKLILHSLTVGLSYDKAEMQELRFDQLQNIAVQSHIISPYSSMIVLVDEAQRKMLEVAKKEKDRFDRKAETGKELLSAPNSPFETTAVPEPEEWALIIAVFGFLLLHIYRNGFYLQRVYETIHH